MRSILLDTNLLVLLIVGLYNKKVIENHKRTRTFTEKDFDLLINHIGRYDVLWVTSHCIAEASNLLKQTNENQAKELLFVLGAFLADKKESHVSQKVIFESIYSMRLGVADTGIIIKSKRVDCVLTVDLDLYIEISRLGYEVINFNHLRTEILLQ